MNEKAPVVAHRMTCDMCGLVEEHRVMDGSEIQWEQDWYEAPSVSPGRPAITTDVCSRACLEELYAKRVNLVFPDPPPTLVKTEVA